LNLKHASTNHRDVRFDVRVPPPVAHESLVRNEKTKCQARDDEPVTLCKSSDTPPIAYFTSVREKDGNHSRPHSWPVLAIGVPGVCFRTVDGDQIR